ncbi:Rad52/Rad22 family DNA repair protein [Pseudomonas guariconensis]|uniref:Rad52/Rad22 family DNA repair protein n=1 Tax=Pseudomonas guariconensis TaxID=1288410 RepID=UPI003906A9E1
MSTTNMRIWEQVQTTDTRYTKNAEVGGQKITSLNGTAMVMKATEVFGPVGIGWGWKVLEERFDDGHEVFAGEGDKRICLGREIGHTVKIQLWFMQDGQRGEVEQYGCTRYQYKTKYGMTTDGEAPKKSLTDAIKKALSMLGFSADVFLGMFDDQNYVQQLQAEQAIEQADDREAEIERQKQERLEFIKTTIETMKGAQSLYELKKIHDAAVRRLGNRNDASGVQRVAKELADLSPRFTKEDAA